VTCSPVSSLGGGTRHRRARNMREGPTTTQRRATRGTTRVWPCQAGWPQVESTDGTRLRRGSPTPHAHRFDKPTSVCPSLAIRSPRLRSTSPLKNVATTGALCGTSLRCAGCLGGWACCGSSWTRSRRPAGRRLPPCAPLAPPKTRHTSGAETGDRLVGGQDRRPQGLHRLVDGLPRRPRARTQGEVLEARPMPRIVSRCQRGRKKPGGPRLAPSWAGANWSAAARASSNPRRGMRTSSEAFAWVVISKECSQTEATAQPVEQTKRVECVFRSKVGSWPLYVMSWR
jgi:hypothetical protein